MQTPVSFSRSSVLCLVLLIGSAARAQSPAVEPAATTPTPPVASEPAAAKPAAATPSTDEFSQAELLKSYMRVLQQLHDAELTIANNKLAAESAARAQAAAYEEKLETLRTSFAAEREHQATETKSANAAQERQQISADENNRIILWIAVAFGGVGLLTVLTTSLLQWLGLKRIAQVASQPSPIGAQAWINRNIPSDAVAQSNQRLISVIDRMERRILELEHSSTPALPPTTSASSKSTSSESGKPQPTPTVTDRAGQIAAFLNQGRAFLNTNKAQEAVDCYDAILALDANHAEALVKKGSALERLQRDQEAIDCYNRAIEADRTMALAYLSKGGVFNRLQRFDEAVECYEKALQAEKQSEIKGVRRVSVSGEWPANGNSVPA
jgi:tetratricopeptide (TPR) repeat protein